MCGIGAVIRSEKINDEEFKNTIRDLLINTEVRGKDAAGIALINTTKNSFSICKAPLKASSFVETKGYKDFVDSKIQSCNVAIIHTRWATLGTTKNPHNNHPLYDKGRILVHNGHISNEQSVRKFLEGTGVKFSGEVDSEVILKLLNYGCSLEETYTHLTGSFAFITYKNRQLDFLRYNNPLVLAFVPNKELFIASSEEEIIFKTLKPQEIKHFGIFEELKFDDKVLIHKMKYNTVFTMSFKKKVVTHSKLYDLYQLNKAACLIKQIPYYVPETKWHNDSKWDKWAKDFEEDLEAHDQKSYNDYLKKLLEYEK